MNDFLERVRRLPITRRAIHELASELPHGEYKLAELLEEAATGNAARAYFILLFAAVVAKRDIHCPKFNERKHLLPLDPAYDFSCDAVLQSYMNYERKGAAEKLLSIVDQIESLEGMRWANTQPKKVKLRTGRNAPCHCGSGKKYKKCCLAKDEEVAASVSLLADDEITMDDIDEYEGFELAIIDFRRISDKVAPYLHVQLMKFNCTETIVRFWKHFGWQEHLKDDFEDARVYAADNGHKELSNVLSSLNPEVIDGQRSTVARLKEMKIETDEFTKELEVFALEILREEERKNDGPTDPATLHIDLIDLYEKAGCPALALLIARGALGSSFFGYQTEFANTVLRLRETLKLSLLDAACKVYSQWWDETREARKVIDTLKITKEELEKETLKRREASAALTEARRQLENIKWELTLLREDYEEIKEAEDICPKELEELRVKTKQATQEAKRAKDLYHKAVREKRAAEKRAAFSEETKSTKEAQPPLEVDETEEVQAPNQASKLCFSEEFYRHCENCPTTIVARAFESAGKLAIGRPEVFRHVKHLHAIDNVLRLRIGAYRMLFSIRDGQLTVLDLIKRRDLESWIRSKQ